jgi:hypothetical protein
MLRRGKRQIKIGHTVAHLAAFFVVEIRTMTEGDVAVLILHRHRFAIRPMSRQDPCKGVRIDGPARFQSQRISERRINVGAQDRCGAMTGGDRLIYARRLPIVGRGAHGLVRDLLFQQIIRHRLSAGEG